MSFVKKKTCKTGWNSQVREGPVSSCREELSLQRIDKCPICKGSRLRSVGKTRTIHPDRELQVDLVECVSCLHWFISPTPTHNELTQLYEKASEYVVSAGGQPDKKRFSIPERYIIRAECRNHKKRKKYLEVGIGRGLLFNYFKSFGYDCFGIEPNPWAQGVANVVTDITELDQAVFNVVVMADVLEHVKDPLFLIRRIGNLMNAGTMYACFPNSQSLRARLSKNKWRMVRPFGHLHFFSKKSLSIMFESNGFHVKRLMKTDLIECKWHDLVTPIYFFPINMLLLITQQLWGDQWVVHLEK